MHSWSHPQWPAATLILFLVCYLLVYLILAGPVVAHCMVFVDHKLLLLLLLAVFMYVEVHEKLGYIRLDKTH